MISFYMKFFISYLGVMVLFTFFKANFGNFISNISDLHHCILNTKVLGIYTYGNIIKVKEQMN